MASSKKILIVGFSGSGKSSFLKELRLSVTEKDWDFSDLDELILRSRKEKTVAGLVEKYGWDQFRLWERQCLEGWLKQEGRGVLALGGGTLTQVVLDVLKPIRSVGIVHLWAPFEDCWSRLHLEGTEVRPLAQLGKKELARVYSERDKIFQQIPWRIENPTGTDLSVLAERLWKQISPS
jgi:shikimate kinase